MERARRLSITRSLGQAPADLIRDCHVPSARTSAAKTQKTTSSRSSINLALVRALSSVKFVFDKFSADARSEVCAGRRISATSETDYSRWQFFSGCEALFSASPLRMHVRGLCKSHRPIDKSPTSALRCIGTTHPAHLIDDRTPRCIASSGTSPSVLKRNENMFTLAFCNFAHSGVT